MSRFAIAALVCVAAFSATARTKCKFPGEICTKMAEDGHNFCQRHECASYGCKEVVCVYTRPQWAKSSSLFKMRGGVASASSDSDKARRYVASYCKKHICTRTLDQCKIADISWSFVENLSDDQLIDVFFCNSERLASGKFCLKHACKVSTCGGRCLESWQRGRGGDFSFTDGNDGDWCVTRLETCRSHSAKDPETIPPREGKYAETAGDRQQAKDEARQRAKEEAAAKAEAAKAARAAKAAEQKAAEESAANEPPNTENAIDE